LKKSKAIYNGLRVIRKGLRALQEFQTQALQLSIGDRWRLVQSFLSSIQQETRSFSTHNNLDLEELMKDGET
jgi:hypothetical protein